MHPEHDLSNPALPDTDPSGRLLRYLFPLHGMDKSAPMQAWPTSENGSEGLLGFAWAILACTVATVLALTLRGILAPANLVLLYLMAVVLVTVRFGRRPGIFTSVLAVLAFDVFLVPPYHSFTVADSEYLLTFAIMLTVALIISHLTAHLRYQAQIAHYRERRASALFVLSKDLSAAMTNMQIAETGIRHLATMFQARVILLLPDAQGKLHAQHHDGTSLREEEILSRAQQAYDRQTGEVFFDVAAPNEEVVFISLRAPMRSRGVLVVTSQKLPQHQLPEQRRLLETCAAQIALAVERVHYIEVAQEAMVAMSSERLRSSLLSAISHDIRTPLTSIIGLSNALAGESALADQTRRELAETIHDEANRMNKLITNLLDMAKLHSGEVKLNKQWQLLEEVVGSSLTMLSASLVGIHVRVVLPATLPLLEFDAVLLERVFFNLLDNAGKYAGSGSSILIEAHQEGSEVHVLVEDDGPGIAPGEEESIFAKFTRRQPESSRGGVGLGLSICRTIIEAHGGHIRAENRGEGGARFIFKLPAGSPPSADSIDIFDVHGPVRKNATA